MNRKTTRIAAYAAPAAALALIAATGAATFMTIPLVLILGLNGGYDLNDWINHR